MYLINVKGLIDELTNGIAQSPRLLPRGNSEQIALENESIVVESPYRKMERTNSASSLTQAANSNGHFSLGRKSLDMFKKRISKSKNKFNRSKRQGSFKELPKIDIKEQRGCKPDNLLIGTLVSFIMSWGLDNEVDKFCEEKLNLKRPAMGSVGCRGAGGYLSLPVPQREPDPTSDWSMSTTLTTQRLLTIVAMVKSLIENYNLGCDSAPLMRKFGTMVPAHSIKDYAPLSLPMLIKYWQDAIRNDDLCSGYTGSITVPSI